MVAIVAAGEGVSWLGNHWRICVDLQEEPCLPARVTLVKMGRPDRLERGALVAYRTDRAGAYFPPSQIMGKRVAAVAGDRIAVRNLQLFLNDRAVGELGLCRRKYLAEYCADRDSVVAAGHVFLLADHPHSFDSRYWGSIPATQVIGRIVWPEIPERRA